MLNKKETEMCMRKPRTNQVMLGEMPANKVIDIAPYISYALIFF